MGVSKPPATDLSRGIFSLLRKPEQYRSEWVIGISRPVTLAVTGGGVGLRVTPLRVGGAGAGAVCCAETIAARAITIINTRFIVSPRIAVPLPAGYPDPQVPAKSQVPLER